MTLAADDISRLADQLWTAQQTGTAIAAPSEGLTDFSVADAYAIAATNIARRLKAGALVAGRKIGLTSHAMQQQLGVDSPDYGVLLDTMMRADGSPLALDELLQPRVEAEIAVTLRADLIGAQVTAADVARAIDHVVPALEIIDSRIRDWKITLPDTIADNASSGLAVIGNGVPFEPDRDLGDLAVELFADGELIRGGRGSDIIGGPLEAIAWLARTLAAFDEGLHAGDLILAGAVHASIPLEAGRKYTARYSWGFQVEVPVS
jgi:2-keto-4-pentenoate hydratase